MGDELATERALTYQVTSDALRVLVSGRVPADNPAAAAAAVADLAEALRQRGIVGTPGGEELGTLLRAAADAEGQVRDVEIARGTPPAPSRDGAVIWTRDFFAAGFVEDASGGVDFWQHRGNPSVGANEPIATLVEPRRGADGHDVYGTKLPAAAPAPLKLRAGPNVRSEARDDGCVELLAAVDGRVRLASGTVTVDNVYAIKGNVGVETGHIVHRGAVVVKGDVEPGSRIEAGGDCEIHGTVERAVLLVGGNLIVHGGVMGKGDEPIRVGGSVRVKFMLDAELEAGDGVIAESEIAHCQIRCRAAVAVPKGRIVAGDVMALGGVTVGVAGGLVPARTVLRAGRDPWWDKEVTAREEQTKEHEHNRARIQATVQPLLAREKALTPQQREAATELLARADEMERVIAELRQAAEAFAAQSRARNVPRLVVLQRAHADTLFVLPDGRLLLEDDRDGPFHIRLVRGRVMVLPGERDASGEENESGPHGGGA